MNNILFANTDYLRASPSEGTPSMCSDKIKLKFLAEPTEDTDNVVTEDAHNGASCATNLRVENLTPQLLGRIRELNTPRASMRTHSKWECVITNIDGEEFVAKINKVYPFADNSEDLHEDYAEFEFADVNESDRPFVKIGAIFFWSVGQRKSRAGTVSHESLLVFPRLPAWSEKLESRANEKAQEAYDALGWGNPDFNVKTES